MTVQEVAKSVMKVSGRTQKDVSDKAGLSGQGAVSMMLRSKSMRVDSLLTILNACGYELVARSVDPGMPEFVIGDVLRSQETLGDAIKRIVDDRIAEIRK